MLNINLTGGHHKSVASGLPPTELANGELGAQLNITEGVGPGLRNDFRVVDAWEWEGGRGARCEGWRDLGGVIGE